MIRKKFVSTILILSFLTLIAGSALAVSLDKVRFIKVAPKDNKAVIMGADGKLTVIKPGDLIGDSIMVESISEGRIVLEEKTAMGMETVIVRVENGRQRIERVRSQAGAIPAPVDAPPVKGNAGLLENR